jgi:hypothetical protein
VTAPSQSFKNSDVLWSLKKYDLCPMQDVILGVNVPYLYVSNLQCFLIIEGHL